MVMPDFGTGSRNDLSIRNRISVENAYRSNRNATFVLSASARRTIHPIT